VASGGGHGPRRTRRSLGQPLRTRPRRPARLAAQLFPMSCCITGFGLPAPAPASAQHLGGRSGCSSARSLSTRTPSVGGSAGCRSNASGCPTAAPPAVPPRVLSSLGRALRHSASCPHLARCPPLGAIAEPEGGCAAPCRLARACSVHDHIPDSLGWPEKTFSFTPERFLGQVRPSPSSISLSCCPPPELCRRQSRGIEEAKRQEH